MIEAGFDSLIKVLFHSLAVKKEKVKAKEWALLFQGILSCGLLLTGSIMSEPLASCSCRSCPVNRPQERERKLRRSWIRSFSLLIFHWINKGTNHGSLLRAFSWHTAIVNEFFSAIKFESFFSFIIIWLAENKNSFYISRVSLGKPLGTYYLAVELLSFVKRSSINGKIMCPKKGFPKFISSNNHL